ncbi:MAG: hypothetical protein HY060_21330 [Proteobacteria bacterium]|nr:hypothetical protein [Pseudomonadota bacterium]
MLALMLLALGLGGCTGASSISPNDPQYARTGAPRAGEPPVDPTNVSSRIMSPGDRGGPR